MLKLTSVTRNCAVKAARHIVLVHSARNGHCLWPPLKAALLCPQNSSYSASAAPSRASSAAEPGGDAAASGSPALKVQTLVAAKGTQRGRLAGAIAAQIRNTGMASVAAMGPDAAYVALRSAVVAGEYLRKEQSRQEIAFAAERQSVKGGSGRDGEDQVEMRFSIRLIPVTAATETHGWPPAVERQVDVRISQSSNVGNVASFLARTITEDSGIPAMRGMGASAVSQALKASILAQQYLIKDADSGSTGPDASHPRELLLVPLLLRSVVDGNRRVEMVLRCHLFSNASSAAGS